MSEADALLKARLIKELGSPDGSIVFNALYYLGEYRWINDGSLRNAKLAGAQWYGVMLPYIDLSGVDLSEACVTLLPMRIWRMCISTARLCGRIRAHKKSDEPEDQAFGHSRGGFSTKIHVTVDALGNPLCGYV